MTEKTTNIIWTMPLKVLGIITILSGIVLVVFSCIDRNGETLAKAISGLVFSISLLIFMCLIIRKRRKQR